MRLLLSFAVLAISTVGCSSMQAGQSAQKRTPAGADMAPATYCYDRDGRVGCYRIVPEHVQIRVDYDHNRISPAYVVINKLGENSCNVTAEFARKSALTLGEIKELVVQPRTSIKCKPSRDSRMGGQMEVVSIIQDVDTDKIATIE